MEVRNFIVQFRKIAGFILFLHLFCTALHAQDTLNAVSLQPRHSPRKAAIMSAVVPGLGQAYNGKYWKIPIIYAGFGTLYYFIDFNGNEYRTFRSAYNIVAIGDTARYHTNKYIIRYNANLEQLRQGRDYYRRNLELSWILTGMLYVLNILDATVDAYLYDFDINDNLSLQIQPQPFYSQSVIHPAPAVTLRLKF